MLYKVSTTIRFLLLGNIFFLVEFGSAVGGVFSTFPCNVLKFVASADVQTAKLGVIEERVRSLSRELDRLSQSKLDSSDNIQNKNILEKEQRKIMLEFEQEWLALLVIRTWKKYLSVVGSSIEGNEFARIFEIQRESIRVRNLKAGNVLDLIEGKFEFNQGAMNTAVLAVRTQGSTAPVLFESTSMGVSAVWPEKVIQAMNSKLGDPVENEMSVFEIPFCCGTGKSPKCMACPRGFSPINLR